MYIYVCIYTVLTPVHLQTWQNWLHKVHEKKANWKKAKPS